MFQNGNAPDSQYTLPDYRGDWARVTLINWRLRWALPLPALVTFARC
jgi:hypothetical protein